MKKRPTLILLFTSMVTIMCRCANAQEVNRQVPQTRGDPVGCHSVDFWFEDGYFSGWDTTCSVKCPDGTVNLISIRAAKIPSQIKTEDYCDNPNPPQAGSPATVTVTPTATATATATPPLLTGAVTACSIKDGFINFKLAEGAPSISGANVRLTINGTQVTCTVAGTNKDVLACALPVGVTFPAQIHVTLGGATTNDFVFDGSGCATQNQSPGEPAPGVPPPPPGGD